MTKPIKKLRSGSLEATIWANEIKRNGKDLTFYSVRIEKNYRDKNNNWKKSHSYNFKELLVVSQLAEQAHKFLARYDKNLVKE